MFGCTPPPVNALTTRMSPYESPSVVACAWVSVQKPPVVKLMLWAGFAGLKRHRSAPGKAALCVARLLPVAPAAMPFQAEPSHHRRSQGHAAR